MHRKAILSSRVILSFLLSLKYSIFHSKKLHNDDRVQHCLCIHNFRFFWNVEIRIFETSKQKIGLPKAQAPFGGFDLPVILSPFVVFL
jgi:hypothetical protein